MKYVKNMVTGTSRADVAVLVLNSCPGAFEESWSKEGQAKQHVLYAITLGVKHFVCCINKMDSCEFQEERYNQIKKQVSDYLKETGHK